MTAAETVELVSGDDRDAMLMSLIGRWVADGLSVNEVRRKALESNAR